MHSDLSPHLHTPECNRLIDLLKKCYAENKFGKFVGVCSDFDQQMVNCLREERKDNSRKNREQSLEKHRRIQERMKQIDNEEKSRPSM